MTATPETVQGEVVGFRGWVLERDDQGLLLGSTGRGGRFWKPGSHEARCDRPVGGQGGPFARFIATRSVDFDDEEKRWYERLHEAPDPECDCGFYALHDPESVDRWAGDSIRGAVLAWGRIEVHSAGFRAQYAKPLLLGLPEEAAKSFPYAAELLRECAARYGARVVPEDKLRDAAAAFGDVVPESLRPTVPDPAQAMRDARDAFLKMSSALQVPGHSSHHFTSGGQISPAPRRRMGGVVGW